MPTEGGGAKNAREASAEKDAVGCHGSIQCEDQVTLEYKGRMAKSADGKRAEKAKAC